MEEQKGRLRSESKKMKGRQGKMNVTKGLQWENEVKKEDTSQKRKL